MSLIASCEVDQPALQQLLYDIEAGMPFLFVDQLEAQAPQIWHRPGQRTHARADYGLEASGRGPGEPPRGRRGTGGDPARLQPAGNTWIARGKASVSLAPLALMPPIRDRFRPQDWDHWIKAISAMRVSSHAGPPQVVSASAHSLPLTRGREVHRNSKAARPRRRARRRTQTDPRSPCRGSVGFWEPDPF